MFESLAAVILKSLHAPCLQKFPPSSKLTSWEQSFEVSHFREEAVEIRLVLMYFKGSVLCGLIMMEEKPKRTKIL